MSFKRKTKNTYWLLFIFLFLSFEKSEAKECIQFVKDFKNKREALAFWDGGWEIFEKIPELRNVSNKGLKLDAKINQIIELADYLCETLKGVPLNELATYVIGELKNQGATNFREQLRIFGKPEAEIDSWFRYSKVALKIQKRKLDIISLHKTLIKTRQLITKYENFLKQHRRRFATKPLIQATHGLTGQIENFLTTDPNMALAVHEKAAEPYWDPDENYGGS